MNREFLYSRHKLSHQQIDQILGEQESGKYPELKGQLLGKVKDFIEVGRLLSDSGINFIPLKGPMLSQRLYGDPSFRYFSDLDLLMEPVAMKKALELLLQNGYKPDYYPWPIDPKKEKLLLGRDNQYNIQHPGKNIGIELHWRPFHYDIGPKNGIWPLLNENLEEIEYGGIRFNIFNPELEALYLLIHGGLHGFRWLKWLIDVKELINVLPPDPERFAALTKQLNAERMVGLCNALLEKHFPGTPQLPIKGKHSVYLIRSAEKAMEEENILPGNTLMEAINLNIYRLKCFPGCRYKKSLLEYSLFSSRQLQQNRLKASLPYDLIRRVASKL